MKSNNELSGVEVTGLTPEQSAYFDRARRVFGAGNFSEVIEDASDDLAKRNSSSGLVKGETRIIGFKANEPGQDDTSK